MKVVLIGGIAAAVTMWPDNSAVSRSRALAPSNRESGALTLRRWIFRLIGLAEGTGPTTAPRDRVSGAASSQMTSFSATTTGYAARLVVLVAAVASLVLLWAAGIPGLVAGLMLGRTAVSVAHAEQARRRERREAHSAAIALETLTAQLHAGAAASRALEATARELRRSDGGAELAECFAHAARRAQFTDPWEDDEPREQLRRIGRLWRVAQRHGLGLAGLLTCAREDLRSREKHRSQTSAALAGPRMTIAILASLPVFGLVLGQAFGASPVGFLSRGIGGIVLVIGVGLVCAGIEWAVAIIGRAEAGQ